MCFAIPGKVIDLKDDEVVVDYSGEKRVAKMLFPVKVGEWVYVSGKIVVEIVPEEDALKAQVIFKDNEITCPECQ